MEDDGDLTRLAVKLLEKEAQKFVRQRSLTKPGPLKANKNFLRATIKHNEITNRRINGKAESSSLNKDNSTPSYQTTTKESILKVNKSSPSTQKQQSVQKTEPSTKINPIKQHKFNKNVAKNNIQVNKLTKDLKVSFKIHNKEQTVGSTERSKQKK